MNKGRNCISLQIIYPTRVRTGCHDAQCQKEHSLTLRLEFQSWQLKSHFITGGERFVGGEETHCMLSVGTHLTAVWLGVAAQ